MIELFILINLAKRIGKIVEAKGRKKGGYQLLLVGLWVGGELFGGLVAAILAAILFDESDGGEQLLIYASAIGGAILGAVVAFQIAKHVEPLNDAAALSLQGLDIEGWTERFKPSASSPPVPDDGYTDSRERTARPPEDGIQH